MKYIIADPDMQLKKILDDYEILEFQGSFATFIVAGNFILKHPPARHCLYIFR